MLPAFREGEWGCNYPGNTNNGGSTSLNADFDIGRDGQDGSLNQYVARDAYGIGLNYYAEDYFPISVADSSFARYSSNLGYNYRPLYNGNISSMTVNIGLLNSHGTVPMFYNYRYDQLNRLKGMDAYTGLNQTTNTWSTTLTSINGYRTRITYDGNGNIQKLMRNDGGGGLRDSLNYFYYTGTNKLRRVKDPAGQWLYTGDLDNQTHDNNYEYDEIGNMISDSSENILASVGGIKWNVYGKITEVNRSAATTISTTKKITYSYDAQGNRIGKVVEKFGTSSKDYTWYVRDAQGNIMAVYSASGSSSNLSNLYLEQKEKVIYGSSRLGSEYWSIPVDSPLNSLQYFTFQTYKRGWRRYELTNHLGNVMAVITDKKFGVPLGGGSSLIAYYTADAQTATDYYPFGMRMPGRVWDGIGYRFGFNGKENDNEAKGTANEQDYGMRIYEPRLGRFLSVDPLMRKYPELTPYQFSSNRVIDGIDKDGLEYHPATNNTERQNASESTSNISNPYPPVEQIRQAIEKARPKSPTTVGPQNKPKNEYEAEKLEQIRKQKYDEIGYNSDGTPKPLTRLAENKTWNAAANNLVFPLFNGYTLISGAGEVGAIFKVTRSAGGASEELITLYRSISKAEMESIMQTKQLSFGEGMQVKQFWQSIEGLENFNKTDFAGEYNLQITIPRSLLGNGKPLNTAIQVDEFLGPTVTIDDATQLSRVNQSIQSITITPIKAP